MQGFQFNHIAVAVKNVNETIAFYQKVFGFDEIENTASNSKTRWLSIGNGKELHLIPRQKGNTSPIKEIHFALATPNIDLFVEHLCLLKIPYSDWHGATNKVHVRKDGIKQIYLQDPDNYWIEVNNAILKST